MTPRGMYVTQRQKERSTAGPAGYPARSRSSGINTPTSKDLFAEVFSLLGRWRELPAYKLEPRVDIFFALYLEEIVGNRFGVRITGKIPEFPIRHGSISVKGERATNKAGRSTKDLSYT